MFVSTSRWSLLAEWFLPMFTRRIKQEAGVLMTEKVTVNLRVLLKAESMVS
jgi:hypothetical protein